LRQRECGTTNKAEGACYISKVAPGRGDSEMVIEWKKLVPCRESELFYCCGTNDWCLLWINRA